MTTERPLLPAGYRLYQFDSVGSTNGEAKRLAHSGAPELAVVWAREQTQGRGRRGRRWISPHGNLYLSLLLYPRSPPAVAAQLGFAAAVALAESLPFPPETEISCKWPNDVLVRGRKIAGILLESETGEGGKLAYLVIGVGVNCASHPRDAEFPATSIAEEGGASSPDVLLERFLARFDDLFRLWQREGFQRIRALWLARAAFLGEGLRVRLKEATLGGRFVDIDAEGALVLERDGDTRKISAGEVFPAQTRK